VLCKTGALTRRYLGTIYTTDVGATGTTKTQDTGGGVTTNVGGQRFLWNQYNQVTRNLMVIDTENTWNYTTDTIRQTGGIAGNKVEYVSGSASMGVDAMAHGVVYLGNNSARAAKTGVGVDATNAFHGTVQGGYIISATVGIYAPIFGRYSGKPGLGYHYLSWNEKGADGTSTFIGDNSGDSQQTGLIAHIWG
jgi:hypothetical protein